jgi:3-hydroxyacyl-[acyl-carrier-protein] dehydratase
MLEAAAQLCSYYATKYNLSGGKVVGFGGLEEVHFRGPVKPGDRLFIACEGVKIRVGRMVIFRFQGLVGDTLVVDGILKGIPLPDTIA